MEKRNVLFVMSSLRNGGAERSLVNLLQLLDYDRYNVDLLLFQNEGMFLKQVPKAVNIISNLFEQGGQFSSILSLVKKQTLLRKVANTGGSIFTKKLYQNSQKNTMWQSLICSANKHIFL